MTVPGETENPAAALANAVWGMREAIALSSTALKKAEAWAAASGGQSSDGPLALADIEPMSQEPWTHLPETSYKTVDLGEHVTGIPDEMKFYAVKQLRMDSPENDRLGRIARNMAWRRHTTSGFRGLIRIRAGRVSVSPAAASWARSIRTWRIPWIPS